MKKIRSFLPEADEKAARRDTDGKKVRSKPR